MLALHPRQNQTSAPSTSLKPDKTPAAENHDTPPNSSSVPLRLCVSPPSRSPRFLGDLRVSAVKRLHARLARPAASATPPALAGAPTC
jgi:hypothetical protein